MSPDDEPDDEPTVRRETPGAASAGDDEDEDTLPRAAMDGAALRTTPEVPGRYDFPDDGRRDFELGRGGIGRVLLVKDGHLGRVVALKELLPNVRRSGNSGAEARFLREARVTAQLEHPGIVPVYELGHRADGSYYYTMRQVRGRTLYERLQEGKTLRGRLRLLPHFAAVCQAMAYAHSRGVVHRDLKAQNVMVGEFGETVVLDWGLAKERGQRDASRKRLSKKLSQTALPEVAATVAGHAFGTPAYMSPEQAQGKVDEVDERSDVWSLGAMLFELLTGRIPFEGRSPGEVMRQVVEGRVRDARSLEREAPAELCAIVEKAMRRDPAERYPSAVELAADIAAFESGGQVRAHAYSSRELLERFARRHRGVLVAAGVAALLLAALATWSVVRIRKERDAADRFATLMLTEVAETLAPVQGSAPVLDRVTRAAIEFYGASAGPEQLDPEQRTRVAVAAERLGEVAVGLGQYELAREQLAIARRLLEPAPADAEGQLRWVELELAEGDLEDELDARPRATARWEAAEEKIRLLLAAHPERADVFHQASRAADRLGWMASREGRVDEAVRQFARSNAYELEAVRRAPDDDDFLSGLVFGRVSEARAALAAGDLGRAVAQLEAGDAEATKLLARAPGVEEYQMRAALLRYWLARAGRYAGHSESVRAAHMAAARRDLLPIESQPSPAVDGMSFAVDVLLEAGDLAGALARARQNHARAPNVERGVQLLLAQVSSGLLEEARETVAWLEPRAPGGGPRARVLLLSAATELALGDAAAARRALDLALAERPIGLLEFANARGVLAGRTDPGAAAARGLLEALDGLHGDVRAERLREAVAPFR